MILTKELEWKPCEYQITWAKTMIALINNKGIMFTPGGAYTVDHEKKAIALINKTPEFRSIQFEKMRRTFELLGYTLEDATERKSA